MGAETFGGKLPPPSSRQNPANYYEIGLLRSSRTRGSFMRQSGLFQGDETVKEYGGPFWSELIN